MLDEKCLYFKYLEKIVDHMIVCVCVGLYESLLLDLTTNEVQPGFKLSITPLSRCIYEVHNLKNYKDGPGMASPQ